jgi:hypothetical protein
MLKAAEALHGIWSGGHFQRFRRREKCRGTLLLKLQTVGELHVVKLAVMHLALALNGNYHFSSSSDHLSLQE